MNSAFILIAKHGTGETSVAVVFVPLSDQFAEAHCAVNVFNLPTVRRQINIGRENIGKLALLVRERTSEPIHDPNPKMQVPVFIFASKNHFNRASSAGSKCRFGKPDLRVARLHGCKATMIAAPHKWTREQRNKITVSHHN